MLRSALGVFACLLSVLLGWIVMTDAGSVLLYWLDQGELFIPEVEEWCTWPFVHLDLALWASELDPLWLLPLIVPAICLLLSGLAGGIVGGRKRHLCRGFMVGVLPGVVLGAILMVWLSRQLGWLGY